MVRKKKVVKCRYVDYWLTLVKTNLIDGNKTVEHYKHESDDLEPDIYVDRDSGNRLNEEYWIKTDPETLTEATPEILRTVEYTPTDEYEGSVRSDWIFQYSYREGKREIQMKVSGICATCEYYNRSTGSSGCGRMIHCDFRNGMYYYCPGYADFETCRNCRAEKSGSRGRCSFHSKVDGVTGKVIGGDCYEWNSHGQCEDWVEAFLDEEI